MNNMQYLNSLDHKTIPEEGAGQGQGESQEEDFLLFQAHSTLSNFY